MRSNQDDDRPAQVILHPDRDTYSVAESIRPRLEIRNQHEFPIEIAGGFAFNWDRLTFSIPHAAHLIGPDGQDLMRPYQRQASLGAYGDPIRVAPGSSEWLYLPISNFLHLRQFGEYTFWLELLDSLGDLHRTNRIGFRLTDVASSLPREAIDLTLGTSRPVYAPTEPISISAVCANRFESPIVLLRPQEDSFYGWVNPIYQFTVLDGDGRGLALARRSGTMATPVYDETTRFAVPPGHSFPQELRLPDFPEMRQPGAYRVRLTYIVRDKAVGKGGVVLDRPMRWEEEVFRGRIESDELVIAVT